MEWVQIKSTLHAIDNKQFLCTDCLSQYKGRPDYEAMTAKNRATKACEEIREKPFLTIDNEINFKTCIGNYYNAAVIPWLEAHQAYQKGLLPFPGALSEQPNKAMEVLRMIGSHQADKADKQIKKMEQQRKGAPKRGR